MRDDIVDVLIHFKGNQAVTGRFMPNVNDTLNQVGSNKLKAKTKHCIKIFCHGNNASQR